MPPALGAQGAVCLLFRAVDDVVVDGRDVGGVDFVVAVGVGLVAGESAAFPVDDIVVDGRDVGGAYVAVTVDIHPFSGIIYVFLLHDTAIKNFSPACGDVGVTCPLGNVEDAVGGDSIE